MKSSGRTWSAAEVRGLLPRFKVPPTHRAQLIVCGVCRRAGHRSHPLGIGVLSSSGLPAIVRIKRLRHRRPKPQTYAVSHLGTFTLSAGRDRFSGVTWLATGAAELRCSNTRRVHPDEPLVPIPLAEFCRLWIDADRGAGTIVLESA